MRKLGIWIALVLWTVPSIAARDLRLVLNWKPEAEFGGFYAAEISGEYGKRDLKVAILPGGVGTPAVQMVAAGQAEFGISSADEVLMARDRGADVVALFAVYQTNPQGFLAREERGIKNISQVFSGGTLAVQKGLPYFLFLEKKYGPIKAKVVPYQGGIAQMAENPEVVQQCFVTSEPILAEQKGLKTVSFLVADAGFNPYTAVVVANRAFLKKHPKEAAAFKQAIVSGWQDYLKNPTPANVVMNKLNPSMSLETLDKSARVQQPLIETAETKKNGLGSMTLTRWTELAKQLKSLGLITKDARVKDVVHN